MSICVHCFVSHKVVDHGLLGLSFDVWWMAWRAVTGAALREARMLDAANSWRAAIVHSFALESSRHIHLSLWRMRYVFAYSRLLLENCRCTVDAHRGSLDTSFGNLGWWSLNDSAVFGSLNYRVKCGIGKCLVHWSRT